jgi:hypothetical protein
MYTKSEDWEYEKEWRMGSFKRPHDIGPHTDYKFGSSPLCYKELLIKASYQSDL